MLRAIVCRIRDIFSIAHDAEIVGRGLTGRRDAARHRGRHLLVRLADEGLHVVGRDAAAFAGRPHAAQIDAQLPREPPHGRAGRRGRMAVARLIVVDPRSATFRLGGAGAAFFGCGGLEPARRRLVGFFFVDFRFRFRLFLLGRLRRAAAGSFFGSAFLAAGFSSVFAAVLARRAASISMIGAPTFTVSPSATRILVILPAGGLGIGIVALSVSTSSRS